MTAKMNKHPGRKVKPRVSSDMNLARYIDSFTELGLLERLSEDLPHGYARAEELRRLAKRGPDHYAAVEADLSTKLARGEIEVDAAIEQAVDAANRSDRDGAGTRIVLAAEKRARALARRVLASQGERLVTDLLGPYAADLVTRTEKAHAVLPAGIEDAQAAIEAGGQVASAWRTITECADHWSKARSLLTQLRNDYVIDGNPHDDFLYYEHPDNVAKSHVPPVLRLAASIANGAEPRIITEDQAWEKELTAQNQEREEREAWFKENARPLSRVGVPVPAGVMDDIVQRVEAKEQRAGGDHVA